MNVIYLSRWAKCPRNTWRHLKFENLLPRSLALSYCHLAQWCLGQPLTQNRLSCKRSGEMFQALVLSRGSHRPARTLDLAVEDLVFRWKTQSGFFACAITFQTQSTRLFLLGRSKQEGTKKVLPILITENREFESLNNSMVATYKVSYTNRNH